MTRERISELKAQLAATVKRHNPDRVEIDVPDADALLAAAEEALDLERRLIRVRQNFTHGEWGTLKSRNSVRDLPLNEETLMALQRLYDNPQRGACKSDAVKDTGKAQKAGDDSVLLGQPCNAFNCKPGDSSSCQSVGRESAEHPANQPACGGVKDNTDPKSAGPRLVFPNAKGNPLDAHNIAARELKPACKAAGLPPIGWHTLRHTAVTLLQQAGATGAEAKAFAGHGSVGMTERYTHAEVDRMRGSVEALKFGETKTTRRVM